jgi:hypothetical protein
MVSNLLQQCIPTACLTLLAGSAPSLPAVRRGFDTLVRTTNPLGTHEFMDKSQQNFSLQRFALASAPSSDTGSSLFGINMNRNNESRGSVGTASLNPRYMTSYNHMSMLSVGRGGMR